MTNHRTSFSFRGYHYDIARGAYLRPEWFHEAIRHAARCGYTHFLPYLENMIRLPAMAKACPEVAYTLEDWKVFERTAKEVGIELVPHFNVIGHTELICAAYPELAGTAGGRELDVERQETRDWMLACLDEFCSVSQARYFLIGGDEWQTPNHLLEKHAGHVGKLWAEYLNVAIRFLSEQKRLPIVWHDMMLHFPEAFKYLSREAVIAFWFYDEDSDYPVLETFKQNGFRTIMASGCLGHLDRRRTKAARCAIQAAERHQADGFLMTSWETVRWESQFPTMEMTAALLKNGENPPEAETLSAYELWKQGIISREEILEKLGQWNRYPDYRAYLEAVITGDDNKERDLYEKYQYPAGPIYNLIGRPETVSAVLSDAAVSSPTAISFGLEITEDKEAGSVLRFVNDEETFSVYPRYGATLQNWRYGGHTIIGHSLPRFLRSNQFHAGGYRSYTRVGGFRPIWALGAHSNPCILWQHPFKWKLIESNSERQAVELTLSLEHADVRYSVSIEKGTRGFIFEAEIVNRLENIYGGWNFNLPLTLESPGLSSLSCEDGTPPAKEPQWFPDVKTVRLSTPHWHLQIVPESKKTAGYFVDRGRDWITPDLHAFYRTRKAGEVITAQWQFSIHH